MTWGTAPTASMGWGIPAALPSAFQVHHQAAELEGWEASLGTQHCQLAQDRGLEPFPAHGAIIDEKIDGIRALWFGSGQPCSRTDSPLEVAWWLGGPLMILQDRLHQITGIADPHGWFIDSELTVGPSFDTTIAAHSQRTMHPDAVLHVFDAIPRREYDSGVPGAPLHERKRLLREAFAMGPIEGLRLCPSWEATLPEYAKALAEQIWAAGGEGIIIKDRRAPYRRERNKAWQKLKRAATFTVEITGWEPMRHKPGKDPPDGRPRVGVLLGTFEGKRVRIGVQAMTDGDRVRLAQPWGDPTGSRAEVTAMERTMNGNLRQPRFLRWRAEGEG